MKIYGYYKLRNNDPVFVSVNAKTQNAAMAKIERYARNIDQGINGIKGVGCTLMLELSGDCIGSEYYGKTESDFTHITIK